LFLINRLLNAQSALADGPPVRDSKG
jgi:hypothetical protein